MKQWIQLLGVAVAAVVFFEAGRWWQQRDDTRAAAKNSIAPLASKAGPGQVSLDAAQAQVPAKPSPAQASAAAPRTSADQTARHWHGSAGDCPPMFTEPHSSGDIASILQHYQGCYAASADRHTDRFTTTADFLFENEARDDGWAQAIESRFDEIQPSVHLKIGDGSCHTNLCRYEVELKDGKEPRDAWMYSNSELEYPLEVQIIGMGYNAFITNSLPRSYRSSDKLPDHFELLIFRTDVPSAFIKQFTTLLDSGNDGVKMADPRSARPE